MSRPLKNEDDPLIPFPVRLPTSVAEELKAEAAAKNLTNSDVFRHYLDLAKVKPEGRVRRERARKSRDDYNRADPQLMRELAAIGNNLNQLANGVNLSNVLGEPLAIAHVLLILRSIERKLDAIGAANAS
jgi:hypothetical protein